jgi:hypothetical protein
LRLRLEKVRPRWEDRTPPLSTVRVEEHANDDERAEQERERMARSEERRNGKTATTNRKKSKGFRRCSSGSCHRDGRRGSACLARSYRHVFDAVRFRSSFSLGCHCFPRPNRRAEHSALLFIHSHHSHTQSIDRESVSTSPNFSKNTSKRAMRDLTSAVPHISRMLCGVRHQ